MTKDDEDFEGMISIAIRVRPELMYQVYEVQMRQRVQQATDAEFAAFENRYMAELEKSAGEAVQRFVDRSMASHTKRKYGRH